VLLEGSIDALDADAGSLILNAPTSSPVNESSGAEELRPLLDQASRTACSDTHPCQLEHAGVWALALPLAVTGGTGALTVVRRGRAFRDDEQALMLGLVERAEAAVAEIVAHEVLREQAQTDPLTRLGNRRKLSAELRDRLHNISRKSPLVLMLFDLDGFKLYNDTFGHVAGDALLARLGNKLGTAVSPYGSAYRLGGDEFCVLLPAGPDDLHEAVAAVAGALEERGETFAISASCGAVLLPHEATTADYALQLADKRMYAHKQGRPCGAREQAADVLVHIMRAKQPDLPDHSSGVAQLAVPVGRRLGMNAEELDQLARAAALHDVGKVGIPDAILEKPGPLDADEWSFVRQHTLLGERILSAAPALRPVATIVRASHERWDGDGYPDGLRGEEIPLAARIVAVCDAFDAMVTDRCYRPARSRELARAELRHEAGRQFDPVVVEAFLLELEQPGAQRDEHAQAERERVRLASDVVSRVRNLLEQAA
jgi:diguanylate cyclase (GGDEF)-like protein